MNDRPDPSRASISFEIGSSVGEASSLSQAWLDVAGTPEVADCNAMNIGQSTAIESLSLPSVEARQPTPNQTASSPSALPLSLSVDSSRVESPEAPAEAADSPAASDHPPASIHAPISRPLRRSAPPIAALKPTLPPSISLSRPPDLVLPLPPIVTPVAISSLSPPPHPSVAKLPKIKPSAARVANRVRQRIQRSLSTQSKATKAFTVNMQRQVRERWGRSIAWSLLWLGALGLSGGLGVLAFQRLSSLPPVPNCQDISLLTADIAQLYCAQEAARSGQLSDLLAGVKLVEGWSENHPLYREAQHLLAGWSKELLTIAKEKMRGGDLYGAIEVANQVPENSSAYTEAQEAIERWQEEWTQGEKIYQAAQQALKQEDWNAANQSLLDLGIIEHEYWRQQQADSLANQILAERKARQELEKARKLASTNQLGKIGEAIVVAQQVSPSTYAWQVAKADVKRWSQTLLSVGLKQWQQGDRQGAVSTIQKLPLNPQAFPEAQDFIWFSHAQQLSPSESAEYYEPSLQNLWNLFVAVSAVQQVPADSVLYPQAQTQAQDWEAQLHDLMQLKVADLFANMGEQRALMLAIEQAESVGADRPRRVQAQTLIAHWRLEIQRIEDRPFLDRAYALAGQRTIPLLEAAIQEASKVPPNRALRLEAQTAIAHWRLEIQRIEDQPLLDEAIALANENRLEEAIQAARRVQEGRALYADAQALAAGWQADILNAAIAQDRVILNEAYRYASKEWYTVAINTASGIGRERPLYGEAQAAITDWKVQRSAILGRWQSESPIAPEPSAESESSYEDYYSPNQ